MMILYLKKKILEICANHPGNSQDDMLRRIQALKNEFPTIDQVLPRVASIEIVSGNRRAFAALNGSNRNMTAFLLTVLLAARDVEIGLLLSASFQGRESVVELECIARAVFGGALCDETLAAGGAKHKNLFTLLGATEHLNISVFAPYEVSKVQDIETLILDLAKMPADDLKQKSGALAIFAAFKTLLNEGKIRAAEPDAGSPTGWKVNAWVKQGILVGMKLGVLFESHVDLDGLGTISFIDKDTYPLREFTAVEGVRIVPGGSSVRDGAYLAPSVVMMPPAYVNVGGYVDEGSMIDSHALVGSCAQIGKRVHLSAASQIGGVLEPIGAMPVIIEDDVMIGGNCGIYEGTVVRTRAVIGTGVILNASTPVYDLVKGEIIRKTGDAPLTIPEGAVVVSGSRKAKGDFAAEHGLAVYTPLIVKYRDEKTDAATALESALR